MATDPVCGRTVDKSRSKFQSEHMGKTYYFCKNTCKENFDSNPMRYRTVNPYRPKTAGCCGRRM